MLNQFITRFSGLGWASGYSESPAQQDIEIMHSSALSLTIVSPDPDLELREEARPEESPSMTVVYYAEWDAREDSGVLLKIKSQVKMWRSLGVNAYLIILSRSSPSERSKLIQLDGTILVEFSGRGGKLFQKVRKGLSLRRLRKMVSGVRPDLIYFRETSWSPSLVSVLRSAPVNIFEINSGGSERWTRQRGGLGRFALGVLSCNWLRRKAHAFICVTSEIASECSHFNKPIEVVTNGFDVSGLNRTEPPRNRRPQLIFVGSGDQAWQGTDKLAALAKAFPAFDFHLVGSSVQSSKNLFSYGLLSQNELSQMYPQMDIGIGTLALHRKGLQEACPLKVREYLAHGLPVIGAYTDPDCSGSPFFLELPNTEEFLSSDLEAIQSFVEAWKGRRVNRTEVLDTIGIAQKESQRVGFFKRVFEDAFLEHR